jgi:hypothetical protein
MNFSSILKKLPRFSANPYLYIAVGVASITVLYLLFQFADTKGLQQKYAVTQVTKRYYRELSHTTVTSGSGSSLRTHSRAVPPAWMVAVNIDGVTGWAEVPPSVYNKLTEGAKVEVVYSRKRISRGLAIENIRLMKPVE